MPVSKEEIPSVTLNVCDKDTLRVDLGEHVALFITRAAEDNLLVFFQRNPSVNNPIAGYNVGQIYTYLKLHEIMYLELEIHSGGAPLLGGTYGLFTFAMHRMSQMWENNGVFAHGFKGQFSNYDSTIFTDVIRTWYKWFDGYRTIPIRSQ